MYIDFHTHKPIFTSDSNVLEIISCHVHRKFDGFLFTVGHHPWWTDGLLNIDDLENLRRLLADSQCIGLGECGLDKLKGANKEIQEAVFLQQIELANQQNVPLIVHCVRQYDQVIRFKKKYGNTPWVIHGFRRNEILAKSLINEGIKLSISPFEGMNDSFVTMLKSLPNDAYFIETDSDYSLTIIERYALMASIKHLSIADLQEQMEENFKQFFKERHLQLSNFQNRL